MEQEPKSLKQAKQIISVLQEEIRILQNKISQDQSKIIELNYQISKMESRLVETGGF